MYTFRVMAEVEESQSWSKSGHCWPIRISAIMILGHR